MATALVAAAAMAQAVENHNEVTRLLEKLDVMAGHHYRGLAIFPLRLRGTEDETDYASLDEGFRGGFIRVSDTGSVSRVAMQNISRHQWAFAMSGEVILGGKQNRMLSEDVLLPPNSAPIVVPTYCVEKDRWTGHPKAAFTAGRGVGNAELRRKALAKAPQAEVWAQVDKEQRRFRISSRTKDFDAVMSAPAVQRELGAYRKAFMPIWRPRAVGFVVAQGGRIVGADIFCNTRLFGKLRYKLIDSYAFDCVYRYRRHRPILNQAAARDFMARIYDAHFSHGSTPGAGSKLSFSGNGASGSALVRRGACIHLHVASAMRIVPIPRPRPPIRPMPRPEER